MQIQTQRFSDDGGIPNNEQLTSADPVKGGDTAMFDYWSKKGSGT